MAAKTECLLENLHEFEGCSLERLEELDLAVRALLQASLEIKIRQSVTNTDVNLLEKLLRPLSIECGIPPPASLHPSPILTTTVTDVLTGLLKLVRNLCAGVPQNQQMLLESGIVPIAIDLSKKLMASVSDHPTSVTMVKTALQFIGNVCVGYVEAQKRIWQLCFPDAFRLFAGCDNSELVNVCCMVIHTCTHEQLEHRKQFVSCEAGGDIIADILGCLATTSTDQSDWMLILLESLLRNVAMETLCESLEHNLTAKIALLEFIIATLDSDQSDLSDESCDLRLRIRTEQNLIYLVVSFQSCGRLLLSDNAAVLNGVSASRITNLQDPAHQQVKTAVTVLRLLCRFTEGEQHLSLVQKHRASLLDSAIALLKQLAVMDGSDASGKHRSHLRSVRPIGTEEQHPLFGLKKDLVQVIGNICYKSVEMQSKVRELEVIPLILNQCSIDHYNPYITQWAVFTIRNLCEDNPANQAIIAGLEQRGITKETRELLEHGCEIAIGDDGKIRAKPKLK